MNGENGGVSNLVGKKGSFEGRGSIMNNNSSVE